jgi:hypothetical protein
MTQDSSAQRSRVGGETFTAVYHTPTRIWVTVVSIIVGAVICGVAFILQSVALGAVGVVLLVGGSIAALSFGIMENVH